MSELHVALNVKPTWKHWFCLSKMVEKRDWCPVTSVTARIPCVTAAAEVSHLLASNYLAFIPSISPGLTCDTMLIACLISNQVCASEVYFSKIQQAHRAPADGINLTEWTMITTQLQELLPALNDTWKGARSSVSINEACSHWHLQQQIKNIVIV